jgi:putative SOS response-associated peptidase YedK
MCGRFDLHSDRAVLVKVFKIDHFAIEYHPSFNIPPSRQIVIVADDGKRHLLQCRWGFLPSWAKDPKVAFNMINARAETVAEKPAFKDAFRRQRCLVVADGFFEWRREDKLKMPVYIRLKSQRPMGFAGLYNTWKSPEGEPICTCSIITTEANELLSPIHDRMPAIIPEDKDDLWLDPDISDKERLMQLLRPYPAGEMEFYEVSPMVNKPEYDSPDLIKPVKG